MSRLPGGCGTTKKAIPRKKDGHKGNKKSSQETGDKNEKLQLLVIMGGGVASLVCYVFGSTVTAPFLSCQRGGMPLHNLAKQDGLHNIWQVFVMLPQGFVVSREIFACVESK